MIKNKVYAWTLALTGLSALTIKEFLGNGEIGVPSMMDAAEISGGVVSSSWSWFLGGAWFAVALFFALSYLFNYKK